MTKNLEKTVDDEVLVELKQLFTDYVLNGKTLRQLASQRGVSHTTVAKEIAVVRLIIQKEITEQSDKFIADVFTGYWKIYDEARKEWELSKDIKFLAEMRKTLKDISNLLGLNAPPKTAVNPENKDLAATIVFGINDTEYKEAEQKFEKEKQNAQVIEADFVQFQDEEKNDEEEID